MHARVKGLFSLGISDLERWVPDDDSCWGFELRAMIGPADQQGEEKFEITVCNASWFAASLLGDIRSGEHTLLMRTYDYRTLASYLDRRVHAVAAETWPEIAAKLAGLGRWEFADYRPNERT